MLTRTGECHQCGECCKTVNITAVRDITLRQHGNIEELKRYLSYRGIKVVGEEVEKNLLFYALEIPCDQLTRRTSAGNGANFMGGSIIAWCLKKFDLFLPGVARCRVHDKPEKPLICHRYPWEPDDIEECGYKFKPEKTLDKVTG